MVMAVNMKVLGYPRPLCGFFIITCLMADVFVFVFVFVSAFVFVFASLVNLIITCQENGFN